MPIINDSLNEGNEGFTVILDNPAGAAVGTGGEAVTILDDDPLPSLSFAANVWVAEGNAGTTNATFTVVLSVPSGRTVTVQYATGGGTATAGVDYVAASGTLSFAAGVTTQSFAVAVIGDTTPERTETFAVTLSNASAASIQGGNATGTIVTDDVIHRQTADDFDGDARTDLAIYRPSTGQWHVHFSSNGAYTIFQWGIPDDVPKPIDFDGDGRADLTVFRPSTGQWHVSTSPTGYTDYQIVQWGVTGDIPAPADFDGDGRTDIVIYRPSTGQWHVRSSSNGAYTIYQWGVTGDIPKPIDFDGDGRADLAVFRPSTGQWHISTSHTGYTDYQIIQWGVTGDIPADFDGDGHTDLAIFRPSTGEWHIRSSIDGAYTIYQWGVSNDIPMLIDVDGDGLPDLAVFRPSTGQWHITTSSTAFTNYQIVQWGITNDMPLP